MEEQILNMGKQVLFDHFGLDESLLSTIYSIGHRFPTPIQEKAIPIILEGRDLIGAAQTGTGKTAAFILPIINRLLPHSNTSSSPARHLLRVLILVPTRELANQVHESIKTYAKNTNLRSIVLFGGTDHIDQENNLRLGCEILVATPGRLIAHIEQGNIHTNNVEILVLDEADRMLDMGFMPDVDNIIDKLPKNKQTLLFSATFSKSIRKISMSYLHNPIELDVTTPNSIADTLDQVVYPVVSTFKMEAVSSLLQNRPLESIIIFANTKLSTIKLTNFLLAKNIKCDSIHGDKSQSDRMIVLNNFKSSSLPVLVATDVAARGLDVTGISCVINFEIPNNPEDYVHRIGRTGRARNKGLAISLVSPEEEILLSTIENFIGNSIQRFFLKITSAFDKNSKVTKKSVLLDASNLTDSGYKEYFNEKKVFQHNKNHVIRQKSALLLGGTGKK